MNNLNCIVTANSEFANFLLGKLGDNSRLVSEYVSIAARDEEFKKLNPDFDSLSDEDKYSAISSYYKKNKADASLTVKDEFANSNPIGHFVTSFERSFAIDHVIAKLQKLYMDSLLGKTTIGKSNKKTYKIDKEITKDKLIDLLVENIAADIAARANGLLLRTKDELINLKTEFEELKNSDDTDAIERTKNEYNNKANNFVKLQSIWKDSSKSALDRCIEILANSDKESDRFWSDLAREISDNDTKDSFFEQVTGNPSLRWFNKKFSKDTEHITIDAEHLSDIMSDVDLGERFGDDIDTYASLFGDKNSFGVYSNAMQHIDDFTRAYLASLPNLKYSIKDNKNEFIIDTDNFAGVPTYLSPESAISLIYHNCDKSSADNFVKSIEDMAIKTPGFEALHQMAEDCRNNEQLKYLFYTTFGKIAVSKSMITRNENGYYNSVISNPKTNRYEANRVKFATDVRNFISVGYNKLLSGRIKELQNTVITLDNIKKLSEIVSTIFPSLNETYVAAYINRGGDSVQRYKNLVSFIDKLCGSIDTSFRRMVDNSAKSRDLYRDYIKKANSYDDEGNLLSSRDELRSLLKSYKESLVEDFMTPNTYKACEDLSYMFSDYILLDAQMNSIDAHGNLSSDIMNCNFINYINSLLNNDVNRKLQENGTPVIDTTALNTFAKDRFGTVGINDIAFHQYDYSNILFTHEIKNPDGTITKIDGLFIKGPNNTFSINRDFINKVSIELFNGARNDEIGEGASYDELVKADFSISTIVQYLNNLDYRNNKRGDSIAKYFMRIGSDAPNIYTITMPRYSTGEIGKKGSLLLYTPIAQEEVKSISNIELGMLSVTPDIKHSNKPIIAPKDSGAEYIASFVSNPNYTHDIFIGNYSNGLVTIETEDGNKVNLLEYKYKEESTNREVSIFLTGTMTKTNTGKYVFKGAKFYTSDKPFTNNEVIPYDVQKAIINKLTTKYTRSGQIKLGVNKNHAIYHALRNNFMQELTNAGSQLLKLFEHTIIDDGNGNKIAVLKVINGKPVIKEIYQKHPEYLIDNYHAKDGKIIDENGLLVGNVFRSNKFTRVINDSNGNYCRNYGNELYGIDSNEKRVGNAPIDFLYGGEESCLRLNVTIDAEGQPQFLNVILTDNQNAAIDRMISEFISDYSSDAMSKFDNLRDIAPAGLISNSNMVDMALNYRVAFNNMDDLFYGDTKFYKDPQDVLKRAKEVLSGGIPTGLVDYNYSCYGDFMNDASVEIINSVLEKDGKAIHNIKYKTLSGEERTYGIRLRKYFNGITIKNTVNLSDDAKALQKILSPKTDDNPTGKGIMSAEDAARYIKNFAKNKVNDGQSWITFAEWVRRVTMRGEYLRYAPIIEKISNNEQLDSKEVTEFIQVQKNFYYDIAKDNEFGISTSRQIKNAEFVIIPQFNEYIDENGNTQKTDLGKLHDWMLEHDVDQVNTVEASKAAKKSVLTLWNNDGIIDDWNRFNDDYADSLSHGGLQRYDYKFLYRQLETPQHVNAANKAGVQIMKKIIDNLPNDGHLGKLKNLFQELFSSNIKDSFETLVTDLDIPIDKDGNFLRNENGEVSINLEKLYSKLREEARRLGITTNEMEYLTIDESTGMPIMPTSFTLFSSKLEGIVQSMINKIITRQTLPGFHAAQVSGLGMTEMFEGKKGGIKIDSKARKHGNRLRYFPNGEQYIEVIVPKPKALEKYTDEQIFAETEETIIDEKTGKEKKVKMNMLEKAGIDKFIGYRIPTEGKQSVAVMKIVGFTEKVQGSTIIVPDDWVAQTGADFDIDSIYAIWFNTFDTKDGIGVAKYYEGTDEASTKIRYKKYLQDYIRKHGDKVDLNNDKIKAALSSYISSLNISENIHYKSLDYAEKMLVDEIFGDTNIDYRIKNFIEQYNDFDSPGIQKLVEDYKNLDYAMDKQIAENAVDNLSIMENAAKEIGALGYNDFSKLSIVDQNTRDARDAKILQTMIEIMQSPEILAEQLSQSNYRHISDAKTAVTTSAETIEFKNRSQYDIFDQIKWQEDCMNGAILKAFSVSRDTFCSICNKVQAEFAQGFRVLYDTKKYSKDAIKSAYGTAEEVKFGQNNDGILVSHNKLGWSDNNKNVNGDYITVYSSETTAYHLDAVKIGGIDNLNTYTFGVYKTFIDMGSTYEVALAFIKQPAIKRIVNVWQRGQSIYNRDYNTAFTDTTIKELCAANEIKVDNAAIDVYTNIDKIIDSVSSEYEDELHYILSNLGLNKNEVKAFKLGLNNSDIKNLPFSESLMMDRLNDSGIFEAKETRTRFLFDLLTMMQFHAMNSLVNTIENNSRLCSPDKFGAKQTIFQTNKILEDIERIKNSDKNGEIFCYKNGAPVPFLNAIYPGLNFRNNKANRENGELNLEHDYYDNTQVLFDFISSDRQKDSLYPSLYNFLKYSTTFSVLLSRSVFDTQSSVYREKLYDIAYYLNTNINEQLYNSFRQYSTAYGLGKAFSNTQGVTFNDEWISYILGVDNNDNITFDVEDLNNPTDAEKAAFDALSPASKVLFIQYHFKKGLIFDYLTSSKRYSKKNNTLSSQYIRWNSDKQDIEAMYQEFRKSYYNDNYFIKSATLSLIDYAIIAEHFKFGRNRVTNFITNDVLRDSGYVDILTMSQEDIIKNNFDDESYNRFIRSHSELVKRLNVANTELYNLVTKDILGNKKPISVGIPTNENSIGARYGLVNLDSTNPIRNYVRFVADGKEVLCKAYYVNSELFYYPLNILEKYEFTERSINEDNDIYYKEDVYKRYCENYEDLAKRLELFKEEYKYSKRKHRVQEIPFDINHPSSREIESFNNAKETIVNHFSDNTVGTPLFMVNTALADKIAESQVQTINGKKYRIIKVPYNRKLSFVGNSSYTRNQTLSFLVKNFENEKYAKTINVLSDSLKDVITQLRKLPDTISDFYARKVLLVIPETNVEYSSISDFGSAVQDVKDAARRNDAMAKNLINELRAAGIDLKSEESINSNLPRISSTIRRYVSYKANEFTNKANEYKFSESESNDRKYLPIDSTEVMQDVINNRMYRDEYLKFLLDYHRFTRDYSGILSYDAANDDEITKNNVKTIQEKIKTVINNSRIKKANAMFAKEYFRTISTDPLIQDDIFAITDGYNNVSGLEHWLSSSLEAGVPLIQVVVKDVLGDIEGKTMKAKILADSYVKRFEELEKTGRFNWNNIIDKDGYRYRSYNKKLKDDLLNKRKELEDLENSENYGVYSVEYRKKLLEYKKWLNKNFNQRYVKEYYDEVNNNEEKILNSFPEAYCEYLKLKNEIENLRDNIKNGDVTDEDRARLDELQQSLNTLQGKTVYADVALKLPKLGEEGATKIYCEEAAKAITEYVNEERKINEKYFESADSEAFEQVLNEKLNVIRRIEQRDAYGRPKYSQEELMSIQDYKNAYEWIRYNAKQVLSDETLRKEIDDAFDALKRDTTEKAFDSTNNRYKDWIIQFRARDIYGIVDGRKFDDEIRARIKHRQELQNAKIRLITPIRSEDIVYKEEFHLPFKENKKILTNKYSELVSKANAILSKAFADNGNTVILASLSIEDLKELKPILDELRSDKLKKHFYFNRRSGKRVLQYIEENTERTIDEIAFKIQESKALEKGRDYYLAWKEVNTIGELNEKTGKIESIPNPLLYSYMKPKGKLEIKRDDRGKIIEVTGDESAVKMVDVDKSNAITILRNNTRQVITHYYYKAMAEAQQRNLTEPGYYDKWVEQNHIYDPIRNTMVPIQCWTDTEYLDTNKTDGSGYKWISTRRFISKKIKDIYENKKHIKGSNSILVNFDDTNTEYVNSEKPILTEEEKEGEKLLINMIDTYGDKDSQYVMEGGVPVKARENAKNVKWVAKQIAGVMGWYDTTELPKRDDIVDYGENDLGDVPMMQQLKGKFGDLRTRPHQYIEPRNNFSGTDEEYAKYKKEIQENNKKIDEDNAKVHEAIINRDWNTVFKEFIIRASRHKAIKENQYMLYYGLNTLKDMMEYQKPDIFSNYKISKKKSTKEHTEYRSVPMENAVELMETFIRRLLLDQYKENHGFLTRIANMAQQHSSAVYMMANVTGGITNVTYGMSQIWQEILAKQFLDAKDWSFGSIKYFSNLNNFVIDSISDKPSSLVSALCRLFNMVEPDDFAQIGRMGVNEVVHKIIQKMYILQTGGEHMMQNRMLLSLMHGHKVVPIIKDGKIVDFNIVTKEQYLRDCETKALEAVLEKYTPRREEYERKKISIRNNKNIAKDFVLRHKFLVTDFLENLSGAEGKEIRKEFVELKKAFVDEATKEWESYSNVFEQFKFDNGELGFADNSKFAQIEDEDIVWRKLGDFRQKSFSINQKIHGVYDRLGGAKLEEKWFGGVVMQFHKHIYPGIMKRFRWNGYYNETRESVEKGSVTSLIDFLHVKFDTIVNQKGLSKEEIASLTTVQKVFTYCANYIDAVKTRWPLLNDAEKANIVRNFGDWAFLVLAIGASVAISKLWKEEDKDDSIAYNLLTNTLERTELELMAYGAGIPGYGLINQMKTLWSQPSASIQIFEDTYNIMELVALSMVGTDVNWEYTRGIHKGENKLFVALKKHLPVYRAINHVRSLPINNRAYARKSNPIYKIQRDIEDSMFDEFESE